MIGHALVWLPLCTTSWGKQTSAAAALTLRLKSRFFSDALEMSCHSLHSSSTELRGLFSACWVFLPLVFSPCFLLHSPMVLSHVSVQPGGDPWWEACVTSPQSPSPPFTSLLRWQLLSDGPRCGGLPEDGGASVWLCFLVQSNSCSLSLSS